MLTRVFIPGATPRTAAAVAAEFPTVTLVAEPAPPEVLALDEERLLEGGARGWALARALDDAEAVALAARDPGTALALLTRLQRLFERRNRFSATPAFDLVLQRHRMLHDLEKPLVRADYDHARDVWQWMLRLAPTASAAAQVAALFHDVERLVSEADRRVEHEAPDYDAFKRAHAEDGARLMTELLADTLPAGVVDRAAELVAAHEQPRDSAELTLLADADALSFFSLNAGGYLDYFGPAQAQKKLAWTLGRLSPRGRARLSQVALRSDVRALLPQLEAA